MDERKLYEAWVKSEWLTASFDRASNGDYFVPVMNDEWRAWQARAALASSPSQPDGWVEQYKILRDDFQRYSDGDPKLPFAEVRVSLALFFDETDQMLAAAPAPSQPDIEAMVNRFLGWPLPKSFAPDCGISFKRNNHPNSWPIGTNLFTADEARQMFENVTAAAPALGEGER